jgi:hypothetical protein
LFDRVSELTLMTGAASGNSARDDLPAFGDEAFEAADVLVIDEVDLVRAELADFAAAEAPALQRLLGRGNG